MSWERSCVCSTKHRPRSIHLGWKFGVTLRRNLIFCRLQPDRRNPFRAAGVILRDTWLDLRTTSDLFDWWKWRGKCSWRREEAVILRDLKHSVMHFFYGTKGGEKNKHTQRKAETNKHAHLWLDCFENRSIHERNLTLKGIKTRHQKNIQYSQRILECLQVWGIFLLPFIGSRKHCRPFLYHMYSLKTSHFTHNDTHLNLTHR